MKIGILTFHRVYNYGAFLQSYSLSKQLQQDFPAAQIEIIDYESQKMFNYYKTDILSLLFGHSGSGECVSLRQRLSKAKQFCKKVLQDKDYVKNIKKRNQHFENAILTLKISNERLVSDTHENAIEFINSQNCDLIVVGSDAIWNDAQTSKPNVYYLGKQIKSKCVSYAASSYGMDYLTKSKEELEVIREAINCFQIIGVRDKATEDYMKLLSVRAPVYHTCDPSIILNLEQDEFDISRIMRKLQEDGIDFSKNVFCVMGGDWLGKIARDLIGGEAQLIALYEPNKYADLFLSDLSPFEWAKVFSLFTITFTHFFHGTLFSLKNGTPTISVEWENDYSYKYDTKILDVLKRLKLENYRFTKKSVEENSDLLRNHFHSVMSNMEYEKQRIYEGLTHERTTYNDFLSNIRRML